MNLKNCLDVNLINPKEIKIASVVKEKLQMKPEFQIWNLKVRT